VEILRDLRNYRAADSPATLRIGGQPLSSAPAPSPAPAQTPPPPKNPR